MIAQGLIKRMFLDVSWQVCNRAALKFWAVNTGVDVISAWLLRVSKMVMSVEKDSECANVLSMPCG